MRVGSWTWTRRMNIKELAYFEYLSRYSLPTNNQRLRRFEGTDKQLASKEALCPPLLSAAISLRDVFTAFSSSLAAQKKRGTAKQCLFTD